MRGIICNHCRHRSSKLIGCYASRLLHPYLHTESDVRIASFLYIPLDHLTPVASKHTAAYWVIYRIASALLRACKSSASYIFPTLRLLISRRLRVFAFYLSAFHQWRQTFGPFAWFPLKHTPWRKHRAAAWYPFNARRLVILAQKKNWILLFGATIIFQIDRRLCNVWGLRQRLVVMGLSYNTYLKTTDGDKTNKIYGCRRCKTHLAYHNDILSRVCYPSPIYPRTWLLSLLIPSSLRGFANYLNLFISRAFVVNMGKPSCLKMLSISRLKIPRNELWRLAAI